MTKKSKRRREESPVPSTSQASMNVGDGDDEDHIREQVQSEEEFVDAEEGHGSASGSVSKSEPDVDISKELSQTEELMEGMNIIGMMSADDVDTLLERIQKYTPVNDRKKVPVREREFDWKKIAFSGWGDVECRKAWVYLRTKTRKYRIAYELVNEVKNILHENREKFMRELITTAPDFPQKPAAVGGAFHCYNREKWEIEKARAEADGTKLNYVKFQKKCYEEFSKLSDEVKRKYKEKSEMAEAEYVRQVKEFYAKYPGFGWAAQNKKLSKDGTKSQRDKVKIPDLPRKSKVFQDCPTPPLGPQALFVHAKINRLTEPPLQDELPDLKRKYMERWANLDTDKKVKWISRVIRHCKTYVKDMEEYCAKNPTFSAPKEFKIKSLLTKSDLTMWEEANGKPPRPPINILDLHFTEFCKTEEAQGLDPIEQRKLAERKFKELDWYEKESLQLRFRSLTMEYKMNIRNYYQNLPRFLRVAVWNTIPKKFQSILEEIDKTPIAASTSVDDTDDAVEVESESSRKRRMDSSGDEKILGIENSTSDADLAETVDSVSKSKKKKKKKKKQQDDSETVDSDADTDQRNVSSKYLASDKPNAKDFYTSMSNTHRNILDAIRGIFDGRSFLGRSFSVYYYYAKYVAAEYYWIQAVHQFGIVESAKSMISMFNSLPESQKQLFIDESYEFYLAKRFGIKTIAKDEVFCPPSLPLLFFPGEPRRPPRSAKALYLKEMTHFENQKHPQAPPLWEELDERTQNYYIAKQYRQMKTYMKDYEKFVDEMTPNDLTEFVYYRARLWEYKYQFNARNRSDPEVTKSFAFPLPSSHFRLTNEQSEPPMRVVHSVKQPPNPLGHSSDMQINRLSSLTRNKLEERTMFSDEEESDVPSSDEECNEADAVFRRKLKRMSRFNYGVLKPWQQRVYIREEDFRRKDRSCLKDQSSVLKKYRNRREPTTSSRSQTASNKVKQKYGMYKNQSRSKLAKDRLEEENNDPVDDDDSCQDCDPKVLHLLKRLQKSSKITIIKQKTSKELKKRPKPPPRIPFTEEERKQRKKLYPVRAYKKRYKAIEHKRDERNRKARQKRRFERRKKLGLTRVLNKRTPRTERNWEQLVGSRKRSDRSIKAPERLTSEDLLRQIRVGPYVRKRGGTDNEPNKNEESHLPTIDEELEEIFDVSAEPQAGNRESTVPYLEEINDVTNNSSVVVLQQQSQAAQPGSSSSKTLSTTVKYDNYGFSLGTVNPESEIFTFDTIEQQPSSSSHHHDISIGLHEEVVPMTGTAFKGRLLQEHQTNKSEDEHFASGSTQEADIVQQAMDMSEYTLTVEESALPMVVEESEKQEILGGFVPVPVVDLDDVPLAERLRLTTFSTEREVIDSQQDLFHVVVMSETDEEKN